MTRDPSSGEESFADDTEPLSEEDLARHSIALLRHIVAKAEVKIRPHDGPEAA